MLKIPEKWPRRATREHIFAAVRVLGLKQPRFYVHMSAVKFGATSVGNSTVEDYVWANFHQLKTKTQKAKWGDYRQHMLRANLTLTSLR